MLYSRKRETYASLLFACLLAPVFSCVGNVTRLVDPSLEPDPPTCLYNVTATLDRSTLALAESTQARAVVTYLDGTPISGQPAWSAKNPSVATVSPAGVVTAIGIGTGAIEATISLCTGAVEISVEAPPPVETPPPEETPPPAEDSLPIVPSPVATVEVSIDSTTLSVDHTAQATAISRDSAGTVMTGQTVTWTCLPAGIATVSSTGFVEALAPGSAVIQGTVSGTAGVATLTVVVPPSVPPSLTSHDFNDGTMGPYVNVWGDSDIDFPADPTASGRGKVARLKYSPQQAGAGVQASDDTDLAYNRSASHVRYNETIWMKGELYLPYAGSNTRANHNRKVIDYTGAGAGGIHSRVTLHRRDMKLMVSIVDWMDGSLKETIAEWTGITIADDTWHTIEVRMTTNSADNVRDGVLQIYMDGAVTPTYSRTTGLGWITEKYSGGSFFSYFYVGSQLTVDPNEPVYSEYRYWDNVAFSTTRIGE